MVLATCLLASACRMVGPDYRGPPASAVLNSPAAHGPFIGASTPEFSPEDVPGAWWRLYDSAALDEVVSSALAGNTDLRIAEANLERSAALLREARAQRHPFASLNFDPSYQQLSAEANHYPGTLPPKGLYDTGISVSYEVDLVGRLRRAVEAASADDDAAKAAYDLVKINVAAGAARAYAQVCNAGEELAVARRSFELQVQGTEVTRRLLEAGRAPQVDFTRSAELAAQLKASIPALEAQRTNALYQLAALLGRPPSQYPRSVASCADAPRLHQPLPVGDATALLRRRPDAREAERELAAATARIGVATAELYPRITLSLTTGSTGAVSDFFMPSTNRFGVGSLIHWQANQSIARAQIAAASATAKLALARFDGTVLTALRDTESALTTYTQDLLRDEDLAAAQTRAREAAQEQARLYAAGKIDFLPLLDAERILAGADSAAAASHAELATDEIALFLALGGGW